MTLRTYRLASSRSTIRSMPSFSSSTASTTRPGVFIEVLTVTCILPIGRTACPWRYPLRVTVLKTVTAPERSVFNGREQRLGGTAEAETGEQRALRLGHADVRVWITFGEHGPEVAHAVDQPQLLGLRARPDLAREQVLPVLELVLAAGPDPAGELLVQLGLQALQPLDVLVLLLLERVEANLVRTRGVHATLNTEPLEQAVEPEARRDHADRADERGCVRVDLVGRARQPVAAGGRDVLTERDDRNLLAVGQLADALADQRGLRRRAAG